MKVLLFSSILTLTCSAAMAQVKTPAKTGTKPATKAPVKTATKPTVSTVGLKTLADSAAYALGADVAHSLVASHMQGINRSLINRSLNDVLDQKPSIIDENSCFLILNDYSEKMKLAHANTSTQPATKPIAKPATKPVAANQPIQLKNLADSAGYALGANIATSLRLQDLSEMNRKLIIVGMNDVLDGKPGMIRKEQCYGVLTTFSARKGAEKAAVTIKEGEAFLEKNKLRPEVKTTASGLQYEVIKEGNDEKPGPTDRIKAHYKGTLIDGSQFDASRDQPLEIGLNQVISGWTEGFQLMGKGSKYILYIPYQLGYGLRGSPPVIPGGAVLVFEVELVDFTKQ